MKLFTWMRLPSWSYWAPILEPVLTLWKTDDAAAMLAGSVDDGSHDGDTWRADISCHSRLILTAETHKNSNYGFLITFSGIWIYNMCFKVLWGAQTRRRHNMWAHFSAAGGAVRSLNSCWTRRRNTLFYYYNIIVYIYYVICLLLLLYNCWFYYQIIILCFYLILYLSIFILLWIYFSVFF